MSHPDTFTGSPWFLVAALMVMLVLGALVALVAFNWGAATERRGQLERDEADLADLRPPYFEPNPAGEHPVWNRSEAPTMVASQLEPPPTHAIPFTGALPGGATPPADALNRWFKNVPPSGTYTEIRDLRVVPAGELVVGMSLACDDSYVPLDTVASVADLGELYGIGPRRLRWVLLDESGVSFYQHGSSTWTWAPNRTYVVRGP